MNRTKKTLISFFIIFWTLLFHYESLRACYLNTVLNRTLPKFPLLFPSAGWLMFYKIGNFWTTAEVYGVRKGQDPERIDPHRIFTTRFLGCDPIHRNLMMTIVNPDAGPQFCPYLKRKFPAYENFMVVHGGYKTLTPQRSPKEYFPPAYSC